MADDSHSVASGASNQSSSNSKMECPQCKKEMQMKFVFNHIRTKHPGLFHQLTTRNWLDDASKGKPLKVMWEIKNDFNEEEVIIIFGCLSTNKTFKSEYQALNHFKKDKEALRDHNKQIAELIKTRAKVLEQEKEISPTLQTADLQEYKRAKESNDPELLDAIKSIINNLIPVCSRLCNDALSLDQTLTSEYALYPRFMQVLTVKDTIKLFDQVKEYLETAKTYKEYCKVLTYLDRILFLRYLFAPELDYPWVPSSQHPDGIIDRGNSRFLQFIYPWNDIMPVMH